jgi:hypothetical protein
MAESKRWVVTTSGDRPLSEVTKELTETGFDVGEVYDQMGVISGAAGDEVAEKLRKIAGVSDVSEEDVIDIGPPDAPVTW